MTRTVKVKWTPPKAITTMVETASIRIEVDEDEPDRVWIWLLENGEIVEGGSFNSDEFFNHILNYYNGNF